MSSDSKIFTYKARVHVSAEQDAVLSAWAKLHGTTERQLAQPFLQGEKLTTSSPLYKSVRDSLQLSDRNANAALIAAEGKVKAVEEARNRRIEELEGQIARAEKVLASGKIRNRPMTAGQRHQKKRRLATLKARLERVKVGGPKLRFGSRKLFRAQFHLDQNGYESHEEWLADWRAARSGEIFIVGRNSETAGNSTCQAVFTGKDFSLRLRVPYALEAQFGSHVILSGIAFHHGTNAIVAAISAPPGTRQDGSSITKSQKAAFPVTYRFVRPDDRKGWLVYVSTHVAAAAMQTCRELGALGIDFNADFVAVSFVDASGNPLPARCERKPLVLTGKTSKQRLAQVRIVAKRIAELALSGAVPAVLEKLDFSEKKGALKAVDPRQARMLSSLSFASFAQAVRAACFRAGVEVLEVNPAHTSVIGAVNYDQRFGLSVHLAAAVAIARRGLSFSERAVGRVCKARIRGAYVTFLLPERNRRKHVWAHWAAISRARKAAIRSHFLRLKSKPTVALSPAESKSEEEDSLFLQDLMAVEPCASTQSGSAYVHG